MEKFFDGIEDIICYTVVALMFLVPLLSVVWIVFTWNT